ncbi:MAG: TlpA disulfide reductase family protein [Sulfuricella sp.]|nr:TlpA disulfide reductase family protein [Sulfuricella sp.]
MNTTTSPRRNKLIVAALAIVALAGVLALLLGQKPAAPAAVFSTLTGDKIALDSLRGKVVLVNFWATSCPGCIKEMPDLAKTYQKYHGRGLETIAVAMSYDPPEYVRQFAEKNRLPFTVALDAGGAAAQAFGNVSLTPTSFVIDKQGQIVQQYVGEPDFAKLHALIESLL